MGLARRITPAMRQAVLDRHARHARRFAFRGLTDPYAILVSEVILQQTQASRGEPAWAAFMARFPTIEALATAAPADALRQWSGLGYNRRALNLQRAARLVVDRHGGRIPDDLAALEALPGIGPYTARAVLALAYGRAVGPVDTNVRRVLGRVFVGHGVASDPGTPLPPRELQRLADAVVPADRATDWTAALMDIGATLCRPHRPACLSCPLAIGCRYSRQAAGGPRRTSRSATRAARAAGPVAPFAATNRWLRGRIMARLSAADATERVRFEGPIGGHEPDAVTAALDVLAGEGLVEGDAQSGWRLPLV